jgi:glycosyltransferase involved in cell wall biosynthesis
MKKSSPLVCICIPTFNAETTIEDTLSSILKQTYSNLLIQIVDNSSTDNTLLKVKKFNDPRIIIRRNKKNIGGEANFTRCIKLSTGKYTAIYHADDIYDENIVEKQVEFLERNSNVGAVFTQAILINEHGQKIRHHKSIPLREQSKNYCYDFQNVFKLILKYSNFFIFPSAMVRTKIYKREIRKWRYNLFLSGSDLDVWLRIAKSHMIGILPNRLMRYRISPTQGSAFLLRERKFRSHLFLVLDYYLSKKSVNSFLSDKDFINFERLKRSDKAVRAVNLYLNNEIPKAYNLAKYSLNYDTFLASISGYRGFATLVALLIIYLFINLKLVKIGQFLVVKILNIYKKI